MNLETLPSSHSLGSIEPRLSTGDGKLALILGVACAVGTALTIPYSNAVLPAARLHAGTASALCAGEGAVLLFLAWAGLRMGHSLGLDSPSLRALLGRARPETKLARGLAISVALGALLGLLALSVFRFVPMPHLRKPIHFARWMGLLGSLGAPVVEEVARQPPYRGA